MISLRQIVQLDEHIRQEVAGTECEWERIAKKLLNVYNHRFITYNEALIIEVIRSKKGKKALQEDMFTADYESFLEIGLETEDDYYPNAYLPIWKCKQEMFQKIGYLTSRTPKKAEESLHEIIKEMLEERAENGDHNE